MGEKMVEHQSIWSKSAVLQKRAPLPGALSVDAAVIGGGMAGLLIACYLHKAGLHTVVLEADRIGQGQTKNTTAKITIQHGPIYQRIIDQWGIELAEQYAKANQLAIDQYRRVIRGEHIDCDFMECPAYLYSTTDTQLLEQELKAATRLGIDAAITTQTELPFPVAAALRFDGQASFHPLKFLQAMAQPLDIYEHTPVLAVDGHRLITNHGIVTAQHVIFACHYPFVNVPGYYFMRMHQERSYVIALENAQPITGMYLGVDQEQLSFRGYGRQLFIGGGNHRTGENSAGGKYQKLRDAAKEYWPQAQEVAAWSAQDCMTVDGLPYIGQFSGATPNWYVATGFQKWGMTSSMVSALLISQLITKGDSPWKEVFSPARFSMAASAKTLFEETVQATKGLTRHFFIPPKTEIDKLPNGHGGVVEYDGQKVGVYKNEDGEALIVSNRCPHMGCQLEWNPDEISWDCPCHGSRFSCKGQIIDNPAQEGLEHA